MTAPALGRGAPGNIDPQRIPLELREHHQWIGWRLESRAGATKPTKVPVDPATGEPASSTSRSTWGTFDSAVAARERFGLTGIGFVFTPEDPYVGIDLDACRDPTTGKIHVEAMAIIAELDSYTEVSPSGRGVHVIARGVLPPGRRKTSKTSWRGALEVYDSGRYFTVTGDRLANTPLDVGDRSEPLATLHRRCFAVDHPQSDRGPRPSPSRDDGALIERASSAANGAKFRALWAGDRCGYASPSEADLALCSILAFWTHNDAARIDRLFRASGLFRAKWDGRRGARTYGEVTIERALGSSGGTQSLGATDSGQDFADPSFSLTDTGNAELYAHRHGDRVRFDHRRGRWLLWDGIRWAPDPDGALVRMAIEAARWRYHAAADMPNPDERARIAKHAIRSESRASVDACLELAKAVPPIADTGEGWDAHPWLLGVANGVVDLRSGEFRASCPDDRLTLSTGIDYDAAAMCPRWLRFLAEVFANDAELITFVQRAFGYSLAGSVIEQVWFLCHGRGANGKTVFLTILREVAGDYAVNVSFTLFELQQRASIPNDQAALANQRVVTSSETNESTRLNEARLKAITGGDPITARFLYREAFTFKPEAKIWLAVNHLPRVRDDSIGFWRRVRLIPFTVSFANHPDRDLVDKLRAELPGILVWAVQGAVAWATEGLRSPAAVQMATDEYRDDNDDMARFLADCCVIRDDVRVGPSELFEAYTEWAGAEGIPERHRLTAQAFRRRMGERFVATKSNGSRYYKGVGLLAPSRDAETVPCSKPL